MKTSTVTRNEFEQFILNYCPNIHQPCNTSHCEHFQDYQCQHPDNPYNKEPEQIEEWPYEQ